LPLYYIYSAKSNFKFDYDGEFETKLKNILHVLSAAHLGLFCEKKEDEKSRDTVPLIGVTHLLIIRYSYCPCYPSIAMFVPGEGHRDKPVGGGKKAQWGI
jgi:hypothetical protein